MRSLWRCQRCDRRFANVNQSHACGRYTATEHLAGKSPAVIALYQRFAMMVRTCARRLEDPRFRAIQTISTGNHVHQFRIETPDQLDDRVRQWLREAYAVREQRHLRTRRGLASSASPLPASVD